MAYKVVMPKAGMAMETGKIVKWLKAEGEIVETGEPLLEIETDKVNMEVEAMNAGVLLKILAHEGDEIPVVTTIGYIGEKGEVVAEEQAAQPEKEAAHVKALQTTTTQNDVLNRMDQRIPATPSAKRIAKEKGIDLREVLPSGSRGQIKVVDVKAAKQAKSTPLAKAIAADMGVDIKNLNGTGFGGKVTKADVMAQIPQQPVSDGDKLVPHSSMRKVIAKRLLKSHIEIPPVTQSSVADVTELLELRKKINKGGLNISINDFIIMVVAKTLKEQSRVNACYTEEGLILKKHINIGVAVALLEGLIVPVIKDADMLTLKQVSAASKALSAKAREGKLMPDEYSDGTFTISNLGMMGVTSFTPIINQPESAILGVCTVQQQLEMDDSGNIEKRFKMGLSLTYDHRSIDGAQAAIFSNRIIELLEDPLLMLT